MVVGTENKPIFFLTKNEILSRHIQKKNVFASQRAGFDDCREFNVIIDEGTERSKISKITERKYPTCASLLVSLRCIYQIIIILHLHSYQWISLILVLTHY